MQRNAPQIEHRQHVGVRQFVLQRESQHVEIRQRRERFQAVQRHRCAQLRLHVDPRREGPFAGPIGPLVHQRVENLQAVMAHPDGVGVGKSQAQLAADLRVILADRVQLAPQILGWTLHIGEQPIDDVAISAAR